MTKSYTTQDVLTLLVRFNYQGITSKDKHLNKWVQDNHLIFDGNLTKFGEQAITILKVQLEETKLFFACDHFVESTKEAKTFLEHCKDLTIDSLYQKA